ncbi:MAG: Rrf2 family transcriptional regulator [Bacillota bacterium]
MRLTKKSEYALLALIDLAGEWPDGLVKIETTARRQNIPKKYLEQILLLLKTSGYVKSIRGANGGYQLAKPPGRIFLAEVIRRIDGPLAPVESVSHYFYGPSPIEQAPKLLAVFQDIRDYTAQKLEQVSLAELI